MSVLNYFLHVTALDFSVPHNLGEGGAKQKTVEAAQELEETSLAMESALKVGVGTGRVGRRSHRYQGMGAMTQSSDGG